MSRLVDLPADRIAQWRARLRLTQKQAAELVGITKSQYVNWESGKTNPKNSSGLRLKDLVERVHEIVRCPRCDDEIQISYLPEDPGRTFEVDWAYCDCTNDGELDPDGAWCRLRAEVHTRGRS